MFSLLLVNLCSLYALLTFSRHIVTYSDIIVNTVSFYAMDDVLMADINGSNPFRVDIIRRTDTEGHFFYCLKDMSLLPSVAEKFERSNSLFIIQQKGDNLFDESNLSCLVYGDHNWWGG